MRNALDKKKLRKEIERDRRAKQRLRVAELRAQIKLAQLARRTRTGEIRTQCARARVKLREQCQLRAARAKVEGAAEIKRRRGELHEEQHTERLLRSADRRVLKGSVRSTSGEKRQESDDEVRQNIPENLVPAFNKFRRQIKGSARMSRTEAFLHWAEENPDVIYALQNEQAERDIRRMVREHNKAARSIGRAELSEVPF